ncbi:MAG: ribonuclease P protein component [Alphaproteobacteria bacterium]|nr:ribonuclease P protein component [Alphaproteobacteria bacterium]
MRNTIKNHSDFAVTPDDLSGRSAYFIIRAKYAKYPNDARYGLVVTKRTFKHAVDRNRAKRLMRDWIAFNDDKMLPNMDYIFVARAPILNASREQGRAAMARALHWIKKSYKNEQKQS